MAAYSVKQAMLKDWGSWDDDFRAMTRALRSRLLALIGDGAPDYDCVPIQGSGTFVVEAMLGSLLPRDSKNRPEDDYSKLGVTGKVRFAESQLRVGTLLPKMPFGVTATRHAQSGQSSLTPLQMRSKRAPKPVPRRRRWRGEWRRGTGGPRAPGGAECSRRRRVNGRILPTPLGN